MGTVSIWNDENVLKVDSTDGCIAWRIYIMGLNSTLKNGKFYFVNISP